MVELFLNAFEGEFVKILQSEVISCNLCTNSVTSTCTLLSTMVECFIEFEVISQTPCNASWEPILCLRFATSYPFVCRYGQTFSKPVSRSVYVLQSRWVLVPIWSLFVLRNIGSQLKRESHKSLHFKDSFRKPFMETIKFQLQTLRRHRWNYNFHLIVFDFPLFSGILNNPSHAIFYFQLNFTCIFRWSLLCCDFIFQTCHATNFAWKLNYLVFDCWLEKGEI